MRQITYTVAKCNTCKNFIPKPVSKYSQKGECKITRSKVQGTWWCYPTSTGRRYDDERECCNGIGLYRKRVKLTQQRTNNE